MRGDEVPEIDLDRALALRLQPDHAALGSLGLLDAQGLRFGEAAANVGRSAALDPAARENRAQFAFVLIHWIRVSFVVLCGLVLAGLFGSRTSWTPPVVTAIVLGLLIWAGWLLRGANRQVRRALFQVLRDSPGVSVWLGAVPAAMICVVLAQYLPGESARILTWGARGALIVGLVGGALAMDKILHH